MNHFLEITAVVIAGEPASCVGNPDLPRSVLGGAPPLLINL
jgi:hypothetical protein